MMIQGIVTGIIVLAAAAYVARYFWRASRGKATGCGCGESTCPKTQRPAS